jgi:ADP-heptose:LPS heptosyltransferase
MAVTTIIILCESCHNLVERYTPLVEEISLHYPQARLVGVFAGFELGGQVVEDRGLFAETHFFAEAAEAAQLLTTIPHELRLVFLNHVMTFRDSRLYNAAGAEDARTAVILRNRVHLQKFFATGVDDDDAVRPRVAEGLRVNREIHLKASLLSLATSGVLLAGRLFRLFAGAKGKKKKVLFIKLDVLGDMIVTIPYVAALRKSLGDAELTVLASSRGAAILKEQNALFPGGLYDRLLIWDAPWHFKFPNIQGGEELWELARRIPAYWKERYDTVIQPVNFGTGTVFALLTLARRVVAVIDPRLPLAVRVAHLVSDPVHVRLEKTFHMHEWSKVTLAPLMVAPEPGVPRIMVDPAAADRVKVFLRGRGEGKRLILFNVGAGHPLRVWGSARFAQLAGLVASRHRATIVLTGSKGERAMALEIEELSSVSLVNAVGELPLNELVALAAMADLVVTVDTGIMHLAAALDRPLVAIYGAGLVDSCRPLSDNHIIVKEELGCSGCADRCFVSDYPPCLERVTAEKVQAAVEQILQSKREE